MKRTKMKWRGEQINLVLIVGIILGITGLILSVSGHLQEYGRFDWQRLKQDFYANAGTELISIATTVIVIDTLNQRRAQREEKARLIREMGSGDRGTALRAVKELKATKWFEDDSLKGARLWRTDLSQGQLWYANLEGADLRRANLREAELKFSNLKNARLGRADLRGCHLEEIDFTGADLSGANLAGSNISLRQIQSAKSLTGAIMPDGSPFEIWRNQRELITLSERKLELDAFHAEWGKVPSYSDPPTHIKPFVWLGMGIGTAVLSHQLMRFMKRQ